MALAVNATFSLLCAAAMLLQPSLTAEWLGVPAPLALQAIAVGLTIFAADLIHQATRPRMASWRALYASVADFLWVACTVVLLALFPNALSDTGNIVAGAVACAVFAFGAWQLWAIGRLHRLPQGDRYRHCILVEVDAPADALWAVVGRLADIHRYVPSLTRSVLLDGKAPGVGAVRACEDRAGRRWSEECTTFEAGREFTVRFRSEASDFPFPATTMFGGWTVLPCDQGSQVMVWWELAPKPAWMAPVVLPLLAFQADRDFPNIVRRMAADAVGQVPDSAHRNASAISARLLPEFC